MQLNPATPFSAAKIPWYLKPIIFFVKEQVAHDGRIIIRFKIFRKKIYVLKVVPI